MYSSVIKSNLAAAIHLAIYIIHIALKSMELLYVVVVIRYLSGGPDWLDFRFAISCASVNIFTKLRCSQQKHNCWRESCNFITGDLTREVKTIVRYGLI